MIATDIIKRVRVRVRCETYMCKEMADFQIGHPLQPQTCVHLCRSCLEQIVRETPAAINQLELDKAHAEAQAAKLSAIAEELTITSPSEEESPKKVEETTLTPTDDENIMVNKDEVYTCKHCGATFKKPSELSKYRSHTAKCKVNSDKEN